MQKYINLIFEYIFFCSRCKNINSDYAIWITVRNIASLGLVIVWQFKNEEGSVRSLLWKVVPLW